MKHSEQTLDRLFESAEIDIRRGAIFDEKPAPLPEHFDFDRIEGMMLGLALGDALGRPTEGYKPHKRRKMHGEVRSYIVGRRAKEAVGLPSDDTQLAFWTLERMNIDGGFEPEKVAKRFSTSTIFGMGQTVSRFRRNFKAGQDWWRCGPKSAGNGALMRIAPMVIPHLEEPTPALWAETALSAMMTHNDSSSIASCVAFVKIVWDLLGVSTPPEPRWWIDTFLDAARDLENDDGYQPRGGRFGGFTGSLCEFVEAHVVPALDSNLPTVEHCDAWYSGAYLLETLPCVLLILARHGHDPEEAIVRAVNDTKDNDTVAAIVGAAVGALHGRAALPQAWIDNHTGRTEKDDDGRIFEILDRARSIWG